MGKIKITQVRSTIKRPERQRRTIAALGLGKINKSVIHEANPVILGMVNKIQHMVVVENV